MIGTEPTREWVERSVKSYLSALFLPPEALFLDEQLGLAPWYAGAMTAAWCKDQVLPPSETDYALDWGKIRDACRLMAGFEKALRGGMGLTFEDDLACMFAMAAIVPDILRYGRDALGLLGETAYDSGFVTALDNAAEFGAHIYFPRPMGYLEYALVRLANGELEIRMREVPNGGQPIWLLTLSRVGDGYALSYDISGVADDFEICFATPDHPDWSAMIATCWLTYRLAVALEDTRPQLGATLVALCGRVPY